MPKFPLKVIIHQKVVEGAGVDCNNCIGTALRTIKSDATEDWEVRFKNNSGKTYLFSFDKHNLEVIM